MWIRNGGRGLGKKALGAGHKHGQRLHETQRSQSRAQSHHDIILESTFGGADFGSRRQCLVREQRGWQRKGQNHRPQSLPSWIVADREIKLGRRALRERSGHVASYRIECLLAVGSLLDYN